MQHPVKGRVRLASTPVRLWCRIFRPQDPRGWADYHCVTARNGLLWLHTHGLARRIGYDLEITDVPRELRREALELMIALARLARSRGMLKPDSDLTATLGGPGHGIPQTATLRKAPHSDREHGALLRLVDRGEPMQSRFPKRLFASWLLALADGGKEPRQKEALCRKALAIFPGEHCDGLAGADLPDGQVNSPDLQERTNLGAYIGLTEALCAQRRFSEACGPAAEAIARCPGWAARYRDRLLQSSPVRDPYLQFWKDLNVSEIVGRLRGAAPAPADAPRKPFAFGRRPKDPYAELLARG